MDIVLWIVLVLAALYWYGKRQKRKEQELEDKARRAAAHSRVPQPSWGEDDLDDEAKAPSSAAVLTVSIQPVSRRAQSPKDRTPVRWVAQGEQVSVAGISLPGGMIYVGLGEDRHTVRRELIDPNLPVTPCHSLSRAPTLNYWPCYGYLEPAARGAYLRWLSEGRKAPDIDIGYVFLFFYGLERRLFLDKAVDEAPALVAEVERLRTLYDGNHSFRRYSQAFLDAARVLTGMDDAPSPPEPSREWTGQVPVAVRLGVGTLLAQEKPLTADWMLAWYLGHEETRLRTPAQRAFDEFRTLFRLRFEKAYPEGLKIKKPQGTLKLDFHPSSGDFHADLTPVGRSVPDIGRLKAPVRKAAEIAEACMNDLDSYSRLLGREPEAVGSLKALALLPEELRASADSAELSALKRWLEEMAGARPATAPIEALLTRLNLMEEPLEKIGKPLARTLAQSLSVLGYGMDPDVDLGGATPRPGDAVAIYRRPADPPPENAFGPAYASAAAIVGLTALVIHADDQVTRDEEAHLLRLVEENLDLCPLERAHLEAHAIRLLAAPPSLAQMRARLKEASQTEREHLARFALAVAAADGHVAPAEIKLMEGIYKALGLDRDQLYGDVHALGGPRSDEPPVVRAALPGAADHAIPPPPAAKPPQDQGVTLDMRHVEKVRGDTHEVSALLSDIFGAADPEPEPEPETEPELQADIPDAGDGPAFEGLDRKHAALLACLLDRDGWAREEFERLCRDFDLLPDGAMEALNEWAFDTFDDPILEDDDPITVNRHLVCQQDMTP